MDRGDVEERPGDVHTTPEDGGSLRLWITLAVIFFALVMAGLGQWDWALAGLIGLTVGNGISVLFGRR